MGSEISALLHECSDVEVMTLLGASIIVMGFAFALVKEGIRYAGDQLISRIIK